MQPPVEQEGLKRYVATLRERIWIVMATTVISTGIAIIYVATADKVYEGAAEMRVIPRQRRSAGSRSEPAHHPPVVRPDS